MGKQNSYLDIVYNEKDRPKTEYPEKLIQYLVDRFNIEVGSKILDTGSGKKHFFTAFEKAGMKVFGIDLENYDGINVFKANMENESLPFEDESFDVVFGKSFLEHIHRPENYVSEVYRTLKKGGKFIILVPNWITCFNLYYTDFSHKQPYTKEAVDDLLNIFGFKNIVTEEFFQLECIWKYPILKHVCKFLQLFGAPKRIVKNKFLRWSRETMVLSVGIKE